MLQKFVEADVASLQRLLQEAPNNDLLEEACVLMADARAFARRRPGAFLLGAVTVGFVTGRLVRNLSGSSQPAHKDSDNGHRAIPASGDMGNAFDSQAGNNGGSS